ncbi:hypothetical protein [Klebsiella pneumoniae]|uniref:hypothetical protein n=1 Tax=Klebsiella pneumoniae TaxID=573 RepID=UPI00203FA340|nr:hypothetical protein [Klebsiella pneumoniae]HDS4027751.1 hypothetical protein [Klebsiella pneumoniae subsp. pneumoniae]GKL68889.1 hypothetical protein NUBL22817_41430 [Klebsiella pneumoniae]HBT0551076.1 hypothetical protein [Klebsiella pneumoniae]HCE0314790.1 hypothetical protein [Klebsiella pneumoniae]HCI7987787.1 hypothetical protein [Klebsiella pneumoniae]
MSAFTNIIERAYKQSLRSKILTSFVVCVLVSLLSIQLKKWIVFDYSDVVRILTAIVFTGAVGLFMKDTISYYDKVAGYDFADFNPKKREKCTQKRDQFLGGSVNNSDVLRDFIIIIFSLFISAFNLKAEFPFKAETIYFIRTLPFPIIFYFLVHYFHRKTSAMLFFSSLETEKAIEKKRNELIKQLKGKHASDKMDDFNDNKAITPDRLRQLLEEKKEQK